MTFCLFLESLATQLLPYESNLPNVFVIGQILPQLIYQVSSGKVVAGKCATYRLLKENKLAKLRIIFDQNHCQCQNGFPHCIEEIHSLLDSSPMFNRLKPNTSLVLWDSQAWSFYFPFWEALHPFYFYLYFYFYFTFPFGEHFIPFPAETFGAFL